MAAPDSLFQFINTKLSFSKVRVFHCPECNSDNVLVRSRRKYVIRLIISLAVFLSTCLLYACLIKIQADFEPPAGFLVVIFGITSIFSSLPLSIYYSIRLIKLRQTTYNCHSCGNVFYSGIVIETRDVKALIADIKKPHLTSKSRS